MKKVNKKKHKQLHHNLIKSFSNMSEFVGEIINNHTVFIPI